MTNLHLPLPKFLTLPFNFALLLWDAAVLLTSNYVEAVKFYHGAVAEILELIQP